MNMSKGEQKIAIILRKSNISFIREKTFLDLYKGRYRFDFYLPEHNILIEYDGEGHFHQINKFHKTRQDMLAAQERDRAKNMYALANQIKLYRIPYWELNNLNTLSDIINSNHLVQTRFHNDLLRVPKNNNL